MLLLLGLLSFTSASQAIDDMQSEDLADLTAIFVFLKNDCGYNDLPNAQIKKAIVFLPTVMAGIYLTIILKNESVR